MLFQYCPSEETRDISTAREDALSAFLATLELTRAVRAASLLITAAIAVWDEATAVIAVEDETTALSAVLFPMIAAIAVWDDAIAAIAV